MDLSSGPPPTLGKYQIRGVLGRGAMGTVYDGWDPAIGRRVAIKTVRLLGEADAETQEGLERFKREAQAAGRLSHPNIVGVYDYGETAETAYIVMEFVEGRSLKQLLDARERFPIGETVRIMEQILAALQFSHDSGVVHRDIKPGNVMMTKPGRVKLADFGIARIESSVMTQDGTMLGTPAYMSPEQLMAQTVDARSDIYAAGVLLYQLLTGERPFEGGLTAIIHKALNTTPPRPSEISVTAPASFDPVVARAMSKRPADRYPDADSFAAALRAAFAAPAEDPDATIVSQAVPAPLAIPPPLPAAVRQPAARPPSAGGASKGLLIGGALAIVLLAAAAGAWVALRPGASGSTPVASLAVPASPPAGDTPSPAPAAVSPTIVAPTPAASAPIAAAPTAVAPVVAAPVVAAPVAVVPLPPVATAPPASPQPAPPPTVASPTVAPPTVASPTMAPPTVASPTMASPALPPSAVAPSTVEKPPPAVASITPPNPAAIRDALAGVAASAGCAVTRFSVADDGAVSAAGIVGTGPPRAALRDAVRQAAGSSPIDWSIRPVDGPYCQAFDIVRPIALPTSPALSLRLKDDVTRLVDGDAIRPILKLPDFPAHLQVDYLSHDGSVTHLFPDQGGPDKVLAANATVPLGDAKKGVGEVGEPFGTDVILAVASSVPLFQKRRPAAEETAQAYLPALQAAIDAARRDNAKLAGRALVLETLPR